MYSKRELMGMPTEDLARGIKMLTAEIQATPSQACKASLGKQVAAYTAELARRKEDGEKVLSDIRRPHMTDGEALSLGLEPQPDN